VRIADRVLAALRVATPSQVVVANDPRAAGWFERERIVADERPGLGPLAGIATALAAARGAAVVVVAWDMPFVTGALLAEIRRLGERGAPAVVPVHGTEGWAEPLCAYYAPSTLVTCRALLAAGARRAGALFDALPGARRMDAAALEAFGDPARLFASVDTPEALAAMGGRLGGATG
jgi:molybdopterin-guanine dinucleotide biosynthesis protein A